MPLEGKGFEDLIAVNIALLRLSGILELDEEKWSFARLPKNLLSGISFFCLSIYSVSYTFEFATRGAYLNTALESFSMMISLLGGQVRFMIILFLRKRICSMMKLIEKLWSTLNLAERKRIEHYSNKTKRLTYCYLTVVVVTIIFYSIASIVAVVSASRNNNNGTGAYTRNLPYSFVVQVHESPYYEITYVLQVCAMVNVGLTCVGVDTIGPVFILVASGHFRVIRSKLMALLSDVGHSGKTPTNTGNIDDKVRRAFGSCLRYHQIVLEFCENIEYLVNFISLTQLLGSTYNISLVGFKLAGTDPDKYKYTTQLGIAVIQLFLCNWPADVLLNQSQAIAHAVYSIPWYEYRPSFRKLVNIAVMRSLKPVQLTAGGFVALSFETFASMISTAASFFTVVSNMN